MPNEEKRVFPTTMSPRGGHNDYVYSHTPEEKIPWPPQSEWRWQPQQTSEHDYHQFLELATPTVIAEYGLRDVHPGRIPPTPPSTLLLLTLFVQRLMAHEPDIVRKIVECLTSYIVETPIIRPIRFLFLPEYRDICRFVSRLPMDWGSLDIRSKVNWLYNHMTSDQATNIWHGIVIPIPEVVHIVCPGYYYYGNGRSQTVVVRFVPRGVFPMNMTVYGRRYTTQPLTSAERLEYYTMPESRLRGSIVPFFTNDMARVAREAGFPKKVANDVGRLLFGATRMFLEKYPKGDDAWREVKKEMGVYNKILHVHRRKE